MQGIRILVVDDCQELRKHMAEALLHQEGIVGVDEAANGAEAIELLLRRPYDIMVTDIVMPVMDGYALLREMRRMRLAPMPQVIMATALARDDFVTRAVDLGAKFYLVKPFETKALLDSMRQLLDESRPAPAAAPLPERPAPKSVDERLGALFLAIGIPAHLKGYQYLKASVRLAVEQPDVIDHITGALYPGVARLFDTTASKVERAIRHAIGVAWERGRVDTLNRLFGYTVCSPHEKPTNGELIAMIADKIRMEMSA